MAHGEADLSLLASPADGQILLPLGSTAPKARRTLVEGEGTSKLMRSGIRSDAGNAACVSGSALSAFGGEGAEIRYRGVSFVAVLMRDRWLGAQFLIAVLTLVGAGLTAYLTFNKSSGEEAGTFANQTAVFALVIATVLAFLKFVKEYRDL